MGKLVAGIDEAGRGPVIGPLVIVGILLKEEELEHLVEIGAKDSKSLTPRKRSELAPLIESAASKLLYVEVTPKEIDDRVNKGITLNQIEAERIVFIINKLRPGKVYIDCPDVDPRRFTQWLKNGVKLEQVEIVATHHADKNIPIVSAASIMAKVRRDARLKELAEMLGEIGSGYPSDPKTRLYIEKALKYSVGRNRIPKSIRSSWKTVKGFNTPRDDDKEDTV